MLILCAPEDVSFKLNCPENSILPLTKDRRSKMNALTAQLNNKLQNAVLRFLLTHEGHLKDVRYVNTNPYFEGHRFCEPGVKEPSYRNKNIWFYPLEYYTGGKSVKFDGKDAGIPSGNCTAMLEDGDAASYHSCLMANGVLENGTSVDLANLTNNVKGDDDDDEVILSSGGGLPDWIARVFHPTIRGMEAYRNAIVDEYNR